MKQPYVAICWIVLFFLACIPAAALFSVVHERSYKQGQIDGAIGLQYYHLYTHDDGTKTWEKVEDPYNVPERFDGYDK